MRTISHTQITATAHDDNGQPITLSLRLDSDEQYRWYEAETDADTERSGATIEAAIAVAEAIGWDVESPARTQQEITREAQSHYDADRAQLAQGETLDTDAPVAMLTGMEPWDDEVVREYRRLVREAR